MMRETRRARVNGGRLMRGAIGDRRMVLGAFGWAHNGLIVVVGCQAHYFLG